MDKLEVLGPITRLSQHIIRVIGQNPGKFTLQGTNTYIVGSRNPYILIDTGEDGAPSQAYISHLRKALTENDLAPRTDSSSPHISDIICSHWHHDHVGGLPNVLSLLRELNGTKDAFQPPKLHKFPFPPGESQRRRQGSIDLIPTFSSLLDKSLYSPPSGDSEVFHPLSQDQVFNVTSSSSDNDTTMKIIHTPGHTSDSIAILLPFDKALYTADTVLGQGTAVFEDLALYISSLQQMLSLKDQYNVLYPAHGPVLQKGSDTINMYIKHRLEREAQIVTVLQSEVGEGDDWTTWTIVKAIYKDYPESLWLPAAHGVDLHLKKLEGDGRVSRIGGQGKDVAWKVK